MRSPDDAIAFEGRCDYECSRFDGCTGPSISDCLGCNKLRVKSAAGKKYDCVKMCPADHIADRDDVCRTMEEAETTRWLKSEGLYVHAQTFFDNKITMDIVNMLTKDDMKDLGVTIGHMKKLENALAEHRLKAFEELREFEDSIGMRFGGMLEGPEATDEPKSGDDDGAGGDVNGAAGDDNGAGGDDNGAGGDAEAEVEVEVEEEPAPPPICEFNDYGKFDKFFDASAEVTAFRVACCTDQDKEMDAAGDSPYDDCIYDAARDCNPIRSAYSKLQQAFHPDRVCKAFPACCQTRKDGKILKEWASVLQSSALLYQECAGWRGGAPPLPRAC